VHGVGADCAPVTTKAADSGGAVTRSVGSSDRVASPFTNATTSLSGSSRVDEQSTTSGSTPSIVSVAENALSPSTATARPRPGERGPFVQPGRRRAGNVPRVHVLLATDANWIVDEVTAAIGGPDTSFTVVRDGRAVSKLVTEREPDVVITDMQVGTMGGMAITMGLRLDASAGAVPAVPIVMLLDREVDVFLASRAGADCWLVKPLDALRLRRAVLAATTGAQYREGADALVGEPPPEFAGDEADATDDAAEDDESAEEETVNAG
jgi:CheY-like chemotaxis protein